MTAVRREVTIELLQKILSYDPETGALTWNERGPELFAGNEQSCAHSAKIWNSRFAGKPAFTAKNGNGYLHGAIFGNTLSAHRVAWGIYFGVWPKHSIDHIDGVRTDNRIANMRDVPGCDNSRNMKMNVRNTSGHTGIHFNHATGKWVASIKGGGRVINLGYFSAIEKAVEVRKKASDRFGYHANHGRAA